MIRLCTRGRNCRSERTRQAWRTMRRAQSRGHGQNSTGTAYVYSFARRCWICIALNSLVFQPVNAFPLPCRSAHGSRPLPSNTYPEPIVWLMDLLFRTGSRRSVIVDSFRRKFDDELDFVVVVVVIQVHKKEVSGEGARCQVPSLSRDSKR